MSLFLTEYSAMFRRVRDLTKRADEEPGRRTGCARRPKEWQDMGAPELTPYVNLMDKQRAIGCWIQFFESDCLIVPSPLPDHREVSRTVISEIPLHPYLIRLS
jgi:hypothetical protein